jgi:hypothetical protein
VSSGATDEAAYPVQTADETRCGYSYVSYPLDENHTYFAARLVHPITNKVEYTPILSNTTRSPIGLVSFGSTDWLELCSMHDQHIDNSCITTHEASVCYTSSCQLPSFSFRSWYPLQVLLYLIREDINSPIRYESTREIRKALVVLLVVLNQLRCLQGS